jgi:uncharacterized repeat protein (TIGR03803 family)
MTNSAQHRSRTLKVGSRPAIAALTMAVLFAHTLVAIPSAHAQTFTVLHNFTGGSDGELPLVGLTIDAAGNLYGTASEGGFGKNGACYPNGCGTVFKLRHTNSGWLFTPIYDFQGHSDGAYPYGGVTIGRDGTLYSTTDIGGSSLCGIVFNLKPPPAACTAALCQWTKTTLYSFQGNDGCDPSGPLTFDQAGNLYGTTLNENGKGFGNVYELSPSNGGWTETIVHNFTFSNGDGIFPGYGGVVFDQAGNLYGMTSGGGDLSCAPGYGCGVVFKLTPSGSGWTESGLYSFENGSDGAYPEGGVIFDTSGNLYGATTSGGSGGGGTVFELSPFNGYWNFTLLASLVSNQQSAGSWSSLVMDKAGNLYGTSRAGGLYGEGTVFKLTPSNGGWIFSILHNFYCATDGCGPYGSVVFDANGNMYGTTGGGGPSYAGTVWEITP